MCVRRAQGGPSQEPAREGGQRGSCPHPLLVASGGGVASRRCRRFRCLTSGLGTWMSSALLLTAGISGDFSLVLEPVSRPVFFPVRPWSPGGGRARDRRVLRCARSPLSSHRGNGPGKLRAARRAVCGAEDLRHRRRFKTWQHNGAVSIVSSFGKAEVYLETCCPVVIGSVAVWRLMSAKERKAEKGLARLREVWRCCFRSSFPAFSLFLLKICGRFQSQFFI